MPPPTITTLFANVARSYRAHLAIARCTFLVDYAKVPLRSAIPKGSHEENRRWNCLASLRPGGRCRRCTDPSGNRAAVKRRRLDEAEQHGKAVLVHRLFAGICRSAQQDRRRLRTEFSLCQPRRAHRTADG